MPANRYLKSDAIFPINYSLFEFSFSISLVFLFRLIYLKKLPAEASAKIQPTKKRTILIRNAIIGYAELVMIIKKIAEAIMNPSASSKYLFIVIYIFPCIHHRLYLG